MNALGSRLCARWVRCYTRRLPPDVATQRRNEITSDLSEHAADAARAGRRPVGHQLDVIARTLRGVPADLSWRREVLRARAPGDRRRRSGQRVGRAADRWLSGLTIVAITYGLAGFLSEVTGILDYTPASGSLTIRAVLAAGLSTVAVAGHLLRTKRPAIATALLVIGGFAYVPLSNDIAAAFTVPVAVALTAVLSLPHRSRVRSNT